MGKPDGVWRRSLNAHSSKIAAQNLANLDTWPSWNSSAQRVLSDSKGQLKVNQRFDLHRIERQRLVEEMWIVDEIRQGKSPEFTEIEFRWLGQMREEKPVGTALRSLRLSVTVLCEDEGGIEIAAWWKVAWWARLGRGRFASQAKAFAKQWLEDLFEKGTAQYQESRRMVFSEEE